MARPIILGVVGDSATGKTTITKGLVEILGRENVTHIGMDDHRRYDRDERAELGLTPLNPACNDMDIIEQHLGHLRRGEPILKPVYGHGDGKFGSPEHVQPKGFVVVEGLLGYHTPELSSKFDVRAYLAPPEELAASGSSSATAPSAATPRSRCSRSLTVGSPTPRDSSARRGNVPISSSPSSLAWPTTLIASTPC